MAVCLILKSNRWLYRCCFLCRRCCCSYSLNVSGITRIFALFTCLLTILLFSFVLNTIISHEEKSKFSLCLHEQSQDDKKLHSTQALAYTKAPKTMNWILFDFVYVNFVCLFAVIIYKANSKRNKMFTFSFQQMKKKMLSFQWYS